MRDHVRLTIQPFDAPPGAAHIGRLMDQLQSDDMLLFATDFPHWQFDGDAMLPAGIAPALRKKILIDNPLGHLSTPDEARMMLDAPLAPDAEIDPTTAPTADAQTRLNDHRRRRASGPALAWPI